MRTWWSPCIVVVLLVAGLGGLLFQDEPVEAPDPAEARRPADAPPQAPIDAAAPAPEHDEGATPAADVEDLPHERVGRLIAPDGSPVAGALVYRSDVGLGVREATWRQHWDDRNRTMSVSDNDGLFAVPDGDGPLHVRAPGFTPATLPAEVGLWVMQPRPGIMAIAHRGGAAHAPENTLAAIHTAALMGAPWVELDVRMTADRRLVVIHDETLERTTDGKGMVALSTWDEVRRLDAGSWFHPTYRGEGVPDLVTALRAVKAHNMSVVIELKMERAQAHEQQADLPSDALVYERTLQAIHTANLTIDEVIVSSFGQASSHTCARITAGMCGWILRRNETGLAATSAMLSGLDALHVHHKDIHQQLVHDLHAACDLLYPNTTDCPRVIAYTVKAELDMVRLAQQGIDGITSGDIDLLMRVLATL